MESSKFGYWLQVGANVGLLVGLVLVGIQINQNSELTRLAFYDNEESDVIALGLAQSGETLAEAWAKAIENPTSLTSAEILQLDGFLTNLMTVFSRRQYLYDQGIYVESGNVMLGWRADHYFGTQFGKSWWKARRHEVDFDFVRDAMDSFIADLDSSEQAVLIETIRSDLTATVN